MLIFDNSRHHKCSYFVFWYFSAHFRSIYRYIYVLKVDFCEKVSKETAEFPDERVSINCVQREVNLMRAESCRADESASEGFGNRLGEGFPDFRGRSNWTVHLLSCRRTAGVPLFLCLVARLGSGPAGHWPHGFRPIVHPYTNKPNMPSCGPPASTQPSEITHVMYSRDVDRSVVSRRSILHHNAVQVIVLNRPPPAPHSR